MTKNISSLREVGTISWQSINSKEIDCHEFATFGKVANSRNDSNISYTKNICHTERFRKKTEVSQI
ncbi:hypothetical protein [Helicobacter sp. T3_23-1059]